ncbi:hypothetical protein D5018_10815 [Parashewanella curva]|uniref:Uncharacterized protein n=2 Tax=Parashewanella curva TaxID=2338552 RepID=A0A3L8PXV4_9GAMM|nr:hypothetical protein D5018_10815 [Parashewanella curva]
MAVAGRFGSQAMFEPAINFVVDKTHFRQENKRILRELCHLGGTLLINYMVSPSEGFLKAVFFNSITFHTMKSSSQLTVRFIDRLGFEQYKDSKYICCKVVESLTQVVCYSLFFPRVNAEKLQEKLNEIDALSKEEQIKLFDIKTVEAAASPLPERAYDKVVCSAYSNSKPEADDISIDLSKVGLSSCADVEGFKLIAQGDPLFLLNDDEALLRVGSGEQVFATTPMDKESVAKFLFEKIKQGAINVDEVCRVMIDKKNGKVPPPFKESDYDGSVQYIFANYLDTVTMELADAPCKVRLRPCLNEEGQLKFKTKAVEKTEVGLHRLEEVVLTDLLNQLGYPFYTQSQTKS